MGILLSAGIGILFMLSVAGFVTLGQAAAIVIALCVPVLGGAVVLALVYGQSGSRVFKRMQGKDPLLFDDDEHWKLGVIYFNSDDPSLFLPERFGIGWTINFARPAAWVLIGIVALATAAFVVAIVAIAG